MKMFHTLLTACLISIPGLAISQVIIPDYSDAEVSTVQTGASENVVRLNQNKLLTIEATGEFGFYHSETQDGYTIVRNIRGDYEYATNDAKGDLVPTGMLAHNPTKRSQKELDFLSIWPKHIYYTGAKLKIIKKIAKANAPTNFSYTDETDSITVYGKYVRRMQRSQRPGTTGRQ